MSITMGEFEVVELYKNVAGLRLGVVHIPIIKAAFSVNIDNIRHIIRYASKIGIKTLILPPYMPYGVAPEKLNDKLAVATVSIDKRNPYIRILRRLSRLNVLSIISPHVLEKSRAGIHVSNLFVDGETGTCKFFSRKLVISQKELALGIKPGSRLDVVNDDYLHYAALLEEDLLMPELVRLLIFIGVDVIIASTRRNALEGVKLAELLKSLQVFTLTPIIHVGSVVIDTFNRYVSSPTFVAIPGNEVFEYGESARGAIITVPLKVLKESRRSDVNKLDLALRILARYLRNIITSRNVKVYK